ncbi:MAG: hemin uptake protein HemP [Planctomycetes bacterium]|nr:hemin uptake protein HemP [Planctomycetota bacterium]
MKNADDLNQERADSVAKSPGNEPKVISARTLFGGQREICIEHEGQRYVLRITRRGKLLLQK